MIPPEYLTKISVNLYFDAPNHKFYTNQNYLSHLIHTYPFKNLRSKSQILAKHFIDVSSNVLARSNASLIFDHDINVSNNVTSNLKLSCVYLDLLGNFHVDDCLTENFGVPACRKNEIDQVKLAPLPKSDTFVYDCQITGSEMIESQTQIASRQQICKNFISRLETENENLCPEIMNLDPKNNCFLNPKSDYFQDVLASNPHISKLVNLEDGKKYCQSFCYSQKYYYYILSYMNKCHCLDSLDLYVNTTNSLQVDQKFCNEPCYSKIRTATIAGEIIDPQTQIDQNFEFGCGGKFKDFITDKFDFYSNIYNTWYQDDTLEVCQFSKQVKNRDLVAQSDKKSNQGQLYVLANQKQLGIYHSSLNKPEIINFEIDENLNLHSIFSDDSGEIYGINQDTQAEVNLYHYVPEHNRFVRLNQLADQVKISTYQKFVDNWVAMFNQNSNQGQNITWSYDKNLGALVYRSKYKTSFTRANQFCQSSGGYLPRPVDFQTVWPFYRPKFYHA